MKPRMFIASSVDNLDLAYAAQEGLEHDVESTVWSQGTFSLSRTAMSSLVDELDESDFGLFVFAPSDVTVIRDEAKRTIRDNVVFELGLFVGRLGFDRCFILTPRSIDDLHLPTDLTGIITASYEPERQDGNLVAALGPATNRIRKAIIKMGRVADTKGDEQTAPLEVTTRPVITDENDIKSILQTWMGGRPDSKNTDVIHYSEVDHNLNIAVGSTRKYIEEIASKWRYVAERKGADTILFKQLPRPRPNVTIYR